MKLRSPSKFLFVSLGLALSAVTASAQLMVDVSQKATFGSFVGGVNNSVTNNGTFDIPQLISTGTSVPQFKITYVPLIGPSLVNLITGTLVTTNFVFESPLSPLNYFSSVAVAIETDFDSNSTIDLVQNYSITLAPFTSPNGLTGVRYTVVPQQFFGSVSINGSNYGYASVVANSTGILFDGTTTTSAIQFQFIATPVPEPSTYALGGVLALGGIVALRRRRAAASAVLPAA